jgi:hypothetical protein
MAVQRTTEYASPSIHFSRFSFRRQNIELRGLSFAPELRRILTIECFFLNDSHPGAFRSLRSHVHSPDSAAFLKLHGPSVNIKAGMKSMSGPCGPLPPNVLICAIFSLFHFGLITCSIDNLNLLLKFKICRRSASLQTLSPAKCERTGFTREDKLGTSKIDSQTLGVRLESRVRWSN